MNELRGRLLDLWEELGAIWPAAVRSEGFSHWGPQRLRFEVWYAQWKLRVLEEGVKAGWLPPDVEHVDDLPEGWAA